LIRLQLELPNSIFADTSGKYHPGFTLNFEAARQQVAEQLSKFSMIIDIILMM
jgi:hypothetical protein